MAQKKPKREKKRGGNKHAYNVRRRERKAMGRRPGQDGNCGSEFCSPRTGCRPWRRG